MAGRRILPAQPPRHLRSAGAAANFPDSQYEAAGATIVDRATAWSADIVVKVRPPDGIRIGLSPLSTSFAELERGMDAIASELRAHQKE